MAFDLEPLLYCYWCYKAQLEHVHHQDSIKRLAKAQYHL